MLGTNLHCKGGFEAGPAGPVLAGPLFQEGSKYFSANERSNARLGIGLEYEPWKYFAGKFEGRVTPKNKAIL